MIKMKRKTTNRWIWLTALLLTVSVTATGICVADRFWGYAMDDTGALPLVPKSKVGESAAEHDGYVTRFVDPKESSFEISSDEKVWSAETNIDIFKARYENGAYDITVESENSDAVIAPGTENAFVFKVKNPGDTALDYTMNVEAVVEPEGTVIPIQGRLCRYDGEWITGDEDSYTIMDNAWMGTDTAALGAGRFTYYTLDWVWPFEQGNDDIDTLLGIQSGQEDVTLTIRIHTVAEMHEDANSQTGIKAPETGDNQTMVLWIAIAVCTLCLLAILLYYRKKEQETPASAEVINREKE